MSSLKSSVLVALGAAIVTGAGLSLVQRNRDHDAQRLRATNAQLRKEANDRQQQSASLAAAASQESASAATASTDRSAVSPPASSPAPVEADYRHEGQATPVAALQTIAWACDRGDAETMAKLFTFESAARPKVEAYFASLPPETRAQWPSLQDFAATMLVNEGMQHPYPRARLLARATLEPVADDVVRVRLPGTPKDNRLYQRIGDDWKWVVTEAMVDRYLEHIRSAAAQR